MAAGRRRYGKAAKRRLFFDIIPGWALGVLLFCLALHLFFAAEAREQGVTFFPWSLLAMLAGLAFEYRRALGGWLALSATLLAAYAFSFVAFLPGRNESHYDLAGHLILWPYVILFLFLLIAGVDKRDRLLQPLHEGGTLLKTLAFGYWAWDRRSHLKIVFGSEPEEFFGQPRRETRA